MKQVLITLPVRDMQRSLKFYDALGFSKQYSDETTVRLALSESIAVMLMTKKRFATFATKPPADTSATMAGYFTLYVSSVAEMNSVMTKALDAGGTEPNEMSDYGFMQQRTAEDPNGHTWNILYVDISKMPEQA